LAHAIQASQIGLEPSILVVWKSRLGRNRLEGNNSNVLIRPQDNYTAAMSVEYG
jgi:hypothetical protein